MIVKTLFVGIYVMTHYSGNTNMLIDKGFPLRDLSSSSLPTAVESASCERAIVLESGMRGLRVHARLIAPHTVQHSLSSQTEDVRYSLAAWRPEMQILTQILFSQIFKNRDTVDV